VRRLHSSAGYTIIETLIAVGVGLLLTAIALPMAARALDYLRISGGARSLFNAAQLAKMRAAATFTRSRLYIDRDAGTYRIESYNLPGTTGWTTSASATTLSNGVSLTYGSLTTPPTNTQTTIGQPSACLNALNQPIGNTSCIIFNSRGIPIDSTGAPTGNQAIYTSDSTSVYAVTVAATGMIQLWRSSTATANWTKQ
jgi:Tfp pilus assembly protein FimT